MRTWMAQDVESFMNRVVIADGRCEISTAKGEVLVVDESDWASEGLHCWTDGTQVRMRPCDVTWFVKQSKCKFYAIAGVRVGGKNRHARLHRLIVSVSGDRAVDHINGNTLDNRRCNLRIAEHWQNRVNSDRRSVSGFRGVSQLSDGRWRAVAKRDGRAYYGGRYEAPEDAARAYDELARKLHGEFACLNFPLEASDAQAVCSSQSN